MKPTMYTAKASSTPTSGSDFGKNSLAKTRPVTTLYRRKSYYSMVVPTVLAMIARRNWVRWVDSGIAPDKTSATAMANLP